MSNRCILDKKVSYRWQTARRICANAKAWLPPPQKKSPSPHVSWRQIR